MKRESPALDHYVAAFQSLRRDHSHTWPETTLEKAPYKPLLLLSVIDLFAEGSVTENLIKLDPSLCDLFNGYWSLIIRLDEAVLENHRFREENPQYRKGKLCVYVGMTGLTPDERFRNHKRGYRYSRLVKRFGRYLTRRKFEELNPRTYRNAMKEERALAQRLKRKGYAVWQR